LTKIDKILTAVVNHIAGKKTSIKVIDSRCETRMMIGDRSKNKKLRGKDMASALAYVLLPTEDPQLLALDDVLSE
jgi:hypothetical protein